MNRAFLRCGLWDLQNIRTEDSNLTYGSIRTEDDPLRTHTDNFVARNCNSWEKEENFKIVVAVKETVRVDTTIGMDITNTSRLSNNIDRGVNVNGLGIKGGSTDESTSEIKISSRTSTTVEESFDTTEMRRFTRTIPPHTAYFVQTIQGYERKLLPVSGTVTAGADVISRYSPEVGCGLIYSPATFPEGALSSLLDVQQRQFLWQGTAQGSVGKRLELSYSSRGASGAVIAAVGR